VLLGALPFTSFKDGVLKHTVQTGDIVGTTVNRLGSPLISKYGGALGAEATLVDRAKQAAFLAYSSALYRNLNSFEKNFGHRSNWNQAN